VDLMTTHAQRPAAHEVGRAARWERWLADELVDAGIDVGALVPDKRLDPVIAGLRDRGLLLRSLAQEEECIAYGAGQFLAGGRPVVLMQSSGLGNALNALGSLVVPYDVGIPLIISMRGTLGELNPSQVPMGRATPAFLAALGIEVFCATHPDQVRHMARSIVAMAGAGITTAMLLDQELEGHDERP
jgi:sulfopyruvate decarboxylase alpha subunit